jgi:Na+/H+-dicarboxylate symporter
MRHIIIILFLLIGAFCFWQITELFRESLLPLWAYLLLCLAGMALVGFVAYFRFQMTRKNPEDTQPYDTM